MKDELNLTKFSGKLPIFPLPNVVHFPYTLLPLHIFENRYRKMLQDALEGEKLIGMAVLKPGWEENYQDNPEIHDVACMGKIVQHEQLEDGRSNILLLGLKRVRIKNILHPYPYRLAKVDILEDTFEGLSKSDQAQIKKRLLSDYGEIAIELADSNQQLPTLSDAELNLSQLCDALAACIGFSTEEMVQVLNEPNIQRRIDRIQRKIDEILKRKQTIVQLPGKGDFRISLN